MHTEREVQIALSAGARVIGVNNRDLETLHVDPTVARRIIPMLPADVIAVAESGVGCRSDVEAVAAVGADAVLVGTALSSGTRRRGVRAWPVHSPSRRQPAAIG